MSVLSSSRRYFLARGACAMVTLGFAPAWFARAVAAGPARRRRVFVAVFQRGAVDGLNMVVPHGERLYYDLRPSIAVPRGGGENSVIDLDGFFGLHPRMRPLHPWFEQGALAIVHATGSPKATRSHFDAQDDMESAAPGLGGTADGWLNRYLRARSVEPTTPLRAVALADQTPRSLRGDAPVVVTGSLERLTFGGRDAMKRAFEHTYAGGPPGLAASARDAFDAVDTLTRVTREHHRPAAGAEYPGSDFGDALRQIAQLIKADVGLEVAFAETGRWDHHANEGGATGQLADRLADLAQALAAFATDLGEGLGDVLVLTMSEFGRTVAENGSRGTDHGHGNAMLALGGSVRGGQVLGRWPGLEPDQRFEGRDLAVTTDFRDVFAEVLVRHLGLRNAGPVFPGYPIDPARFPGLIA